MTQQLPEHTGGHEATALLCSDATGEAAEKLRKGQTTDKERNLELRQSRELQKLYTSSALCSMSQLRM